MAKGKEKDEAKAEDNGIYAVRINFILELELDFWFPGCVGFHNPMGHCPTAPKEWMYGVKLPFGMLEIGNYLVGRDE